MLQSCATANTAVSAGGGNRTQYCTRGDDLQAISVAEHTWKRTRCCMEKSWSCATMYTRPFPRRLPSHKSGRTPLPVSASITVRSRSKEPVLTRVLCGRSEALNPDCRRRPNKAQTGPIFHSSSRAHMCLHSASASIDVFFFEADMLRGRDNVGLIKENEHNFVQPLVKPRAQRGRHTTSQRTARVGVALGGFAGLSRCHELRHDRLPSSFYGVARISASTTQTSM